ncbi:PAS domain-containing protein [Candidatus Gracilibacteria bacterium]|nr:PAS domain-containing protein [Candidatus Gracilibacteria bacterium]
MSSSHSNASFSAQDILDRCPNLIYIYDLVEQRNAYANREIATVLGYSVAEIQAMGATIFIELVHPDDLPAIGVHQQRIAAASDDDTYTIEYRMRHKAGDWRWLVSRDAVFSRTPTGSVQQYIGVVDDQTEKRATLEWAQRALQLNPMLVYVYDLIEQRNIYANAELGQVLGFDTDELQAMGAQMLSQLMHPDDLAELPNTQQRIAAAGDEDTVGTTYRMRHKNGSWVWLQDNVRVFVRSANGAVRQYLGAIQDVTFRKQEQEERDQLQAQVISAQQAALRELSTPLIPVSDNVLVMPLIGTIDSQRAQMVMESLLEGVAENNASTVILDITGVQVVDTQVASALIRSAQAVKLLGATVIITGIRPEVAQTLVHLGADLSSMVTRGTLQSGIAYALNS